jgi:DNA-binding LacI/PurR family transcriptional regulator
MEPPEDLPAPAPDRPGRVTLKALAAALGLSPMTVSNAYNRPDQIAPATRARVLAEAARLGYAGPDPTARSLRRRRAGTVGILYAGPLSFAFSDPAAVLFLQGFSLATEPARLRLLLLSGLPGERALVAEAAVDALVSFALADDDPLLAEALARRLPLVLVDQTPHPGVDRVGIDDEGAAQAAATHLLALGHRCLGILSLSLCGGARQSGWAGIDRQAIATHPVARRRLQGYAAALRAAGIDWREIPVYECAATTPDEGATAAAWLLGQRPRPTALLAMSDQ